ncbi:MAG: DUF2628 domain-containing protein [Clostridia bacterium]|nr:DUF2628 domain-containing protein [Clostridia bacterium]
MLHQNDTCPVCGQAFTETDDVVYCPDCGAPHHRACWKQNGRCAHADEHADGYVWHSAGPADDAAQDARHNTSRRAQESLRCPRCGEECGPDTLVCPECGQRLGVFSGSARFDFNPDYFLRGVDGDPESDLGGVTVREVAMFTQYRTVSYVRKFRQLGEKKLGWNWAAFLFSPFWFFYRKIYKAGAFFMGILLALSVFAAIPLSKVQEQATEVLLEYVKMDENTTPDQIMAAVAKLEDAQKQKVQSAVLRYSKGLLLYIAVLFLPNFAAAAAADGLYKKKIVRDAEAIRDFAQNDQTFRMLALRRGGVSLLGVLASYMLFELFLQAVMYYL